MELNKGIYKNISKSELHRVASKNQVLLQHDLINELSKDIYKNISMSKLHRETSKTPVLPCPDVIEWITQKLDHESRTILKLEERI